MPPVAAAPPIIGTLGRRRRPVRAIGFARDAPRTPSQSPGEGRLPPVRVRHASRQKAEHVARGHGTKDPTTLDAIFSCDASARRSFCAKATWAPSTTSLSPKASGAAAKRSPLVSILRSSRSDGSLKGFRSEPLESLTLRSFAIGSFSRRSIAYCASRRCLRFQWRALSSFRAQRWRHVTSADSSISRGFGTPNNCLADQRRPAAVETARTMPVFQLELGFSSNAKRATGRVCYLCQTS